MVWASLAAKKQQQKLEIEKKGGVYGDFSLFDKNRKFPRYLLSAKSFDQKNASGRLGMFSRVITSKCIVFILTNSELADFQFLKKERRVLIFLQTNSINKHKEALVRDIETV